MGNYAGFWLRVGALFIDVFITSVIPMAVVIGAILIPMYLNTSPIITEEYHSPIKLLLPWFMFVMSVIYFPLCHMSSWQATIGKRLLKLKVVQTKNQTKITPGGAILRSVPLLSLLFINQVDHLIPSTYWETLVAKVVIYLLWAPLVISFVMAAFDKEKRTLGDRLASTRVIKAYNKSLN